MTVLVSGEQTNGEYAIAHVIEPPKLGPPLHIHKDEDEAFYILKGQFTFFVGTRLSKYQLEIMYLLLEVFLIDSYQDQNNLNLLLLQLQQALIDL